jgi:hypothetical protein
MASATQHRIQVFIVRRVLSAGTTQEKAPGGLTDSSDIEYDDEGEFGHWHASW